MDVTSGGHIDHIVPIRKGGSRTDGRNLMTLCRTCHDIKTRLERDKDIVNPTGQDGEQYVRTEDKARLITLLTKYV